MSYLDLPRICFSGRFYANPSTINNDANNYNPSIPLSPAWNPMGDHLFRIFDCEVTSCRDAHGVLSDQAAQNKLIGATLNSLKPPAVMVDLDAMQQNRTQLFGIRLAFLTLDKTAGFTASMKTPAMADVSERIPNKGFDPYLRAMFQTVLDAVEWSGLETSPFLASLQQRSSNTGALSIKFVLSGYQGNTSKPDFSTGVIVGIIGPAYLGEPDNFLAKRRLWPVTSLQSFFAPAPFQVDTSRAVPVLVLDLSNSLPGQGFRMPLMNIGPMAALALRGQTLRVQTSGPVATHFRAAATFMDPTGQPIYMDAGEHPVLISIGGVQYDDSHRESGIVEIPLNPGQTNALAANPLALQATAGAAPVLLMTEPANGILVGSTQTNLRISPDDPPVTVNLIVTEFGERKSGYQVPLTLVSSDPPPIIPGKPPLFPPMVTSGDQGIAPVVITPCDPGNPADRQYFSSVLYMIGGPWAEIAPISGEPQDAINILLFKPTPDNPCPIWSDVAPFLKVYARIYPRMKEFVDFSSFESVMANASAIRPMLLLPENDPGHMPISRDLPPKQREIIVKCIDNGTPTGRLPFQLEIEPSPITSMPGLQGFSFAQANGKWLFIGGRTNGMHSFTGPPFPKESANWNIWVFDPQTAQAWSAPVPAALQESLVSWDAQSYQDGDWLYIIGGYGYTADSMTTFPKLTAVKVSALIDAVMVGTVVDPCFSQVENWQAKVTGGKLGKMGPYYYLAMGQNFDGAYTQSGYGTDYTYLYTEQILVLQIQNDPLSMTVVGSMPTPLQQICGPYHRRDFTMSAAIRPDGNPGLDVYGGVFRGGSMKPYREPILIDNSVSNYFGVTQVDQNYHQFMNQYDCACLPAWQQSTRTMFTTLFGGISLYTADWKRKRIRKDPDLPWVDSITTLVRTPDGNYSEQIHPVSLPQKMGGDAMFIPAPGVPLSENGVILLDEIKGRTLVGYVFGGIVALPKQPGQQETPTAANTVMLKVYLTPGCQPCMLAGSE